MSDSNHNIFSILQIHEHLPDIQQKIIFHLGIFSFGTSSIAILLFVLLFIFIAIWIRGYKVIPSTMQSLFEMLIEWTYNFINSIIGDKDKTDKVFPYIATVFLFILFSNLLFLIPGIFSWTYNDYPLLSSATADFNTTFALALAGVVLIQLSSIRYRGLFSYLGHFIQIAPIVKGFRKSIADGFLGIIQFFVGLIEIIGELAKIISLSLRLFGNIFAHEVLTIILIGAFSIGLPAIWMGFGILVGVVQAIVFTALISVYYILMHSKSGH